jgi:hypothetical protein
MSGLWILGAGAAGFLVVRGLVTRADARARLSAIQTRGALPSAKVVSQPGKQNV